MREFADNELPKNTQELIDDKRMKLSQELSAVS
jgi:hypothetical protein